MRFAVLLVLFCSVLPSCGSGEASVSAGTEADADSEKVPVIVSMPARRDLFASYSATATISSDADAPVIARIEGEVTEILVEEGDRVTAGDVLARLDGERYRLEMLAAKAELERADRDYRRNLDLHERGIVSASAFEGLRYDLDALRAGYELAQLNYSYAAIRASIDGVVAAREIKLGQNLVAGATAFRVTDGRELLGYLQVPQAELPKFVAGHAADVEVASMPGRRFPATIARISPTIDTRTGTFRATVRINNAGGELAPGMFGKFSVAYEKHSDVLTIPLAALLDEDSEQAVYVLSGDTVERRVIETGIDDGERIEVLAGLSSADAVVVIGHSGLRDGARVLASNSNNDRLAG